MRWGGKWKIPVPHSTFQSVLQTQDLSFHCFHGQLAPRPSHLNCLIPFWLLPALSVPSSPCHVFQPWKMPTFFCLETATFNFVFIALELLVFSAIRQSNSVESPCCSCAWQEIIIILLKVTNWFTFNAEQVLNRHLEKIMQHRDAHSIKIL